MVFPIPPRYTKADVMFLKELIEAGEVPGGHRSALPAGAGRRGDRYVETERKTGNVVLTVSGGP